MSLQIATRQIPGMYNTPPVPSAYVCDRRQRPYRSDVERLVLPEAVTRVPEPMPDIENQMRALPQPTWLASIKRWLGL